ncbi:MAG: hypothetical protein IJH94_04875, partial [Clostridia bacterium]|nr:hypothetical protein [Clostridia bacterium]
MLRKRISAALAAVMMLTSFGTASAVYDADVIPVQAEAQDELRVAAAESRPQTSKFSYSLAGEELTVSINGQTIKNNIDEDINVIVAVYENDILRKTKLYTISADYPEVNLRDWKTTYSGDKDALKVKAFIWTADGKCRPLEESSELYDTPGTIYKVYGRVISTSRGTSLRRGEVKFRIERSDDFDGREITPGNSVIETVQVGNTNAEDMQFIYSEAFIAITLDGTLTMTSIESCGPSRTVTFAAKDLADDDKNIGTNYVDGVKAPKLPVYKNGSSSSTTKYDLSYDYAYYSNAVMYVNGVDIGIATDSKIDSYILRNTTGSVTLIDETEVGSTSTDGKYEYIMVDYYVDAVVDYVSATSASARIYFKNSDGAGTKMEWDPEDSDIDIKFKKDGKEIAYTDLAEFDVLSIQYDMVNDNLTDFDYANVLVSSNVAEGSVTSTDSADQTITLGGTEYYLNENMTNVNDYELGTAYKIYLDAFGYAAYFDEGSSEKNYGVIVSMQKSSGDVYPTVSLVTANGEIVSYECKDDTEAKMFYNYAVNGYPGGTGYWRAFTKYDIAQQIKSGATVCTYRITRGRIEFDKAFYGNGGADLEYKASSSKIGSYSIGKYTRIIDMDRYMNNDKDNVSTLSVSDFEDEATYTAYFFDKNSDSVYRFGIVFEGISVIRPE